MKKNYKRFGLSIALFIFFIIYPTIIVQTEYEDKIRNEMEPSSIENATFGEKNKLYGIILSSIFNPNTLKKNK